MSKIGIIGVGSVGGAVASRLLACETANEIVLIDADAARTKAAALDLTHAAAFGHNAKIIAGNYADLRDADIVIISAGQNQKPMQTRTELVENNAAVMLDIVPKIMRSVNKNKIIIVVVSNPLDSIVMAVKNISGLPAERVIGTGTMLDSARFRSALAEHFGVSPESVDAYVLGEHGDSSLVSFDSALLGGMEIPKLPAKKKREIADYVRGAAYEIIQGRGATWDGIGGAAAVLCRAILNDENLILPVSIMREKTAYSIPRIVGRTGVVRDLVPNLAKAEQAELNASISAIAKTYQIVE